MLTEGESIIDGGFSIYVGLKEEQGWHCSFLRIKVLLVFHPSFPILKLAVVRQFLDPTAQKANIAWSTYHGIVSQFWGFNPIYNVIIYFKHI